MWIFLVQNDFDTMFLYVLNIQSVYDLEKGRKKKFKLKIMRFNISVREIGIQI